MQRILSAQLKRISKDRVRFEITRDNYEAFCNAVGLYRKEFMNCLKKSEANHRPGRITRRKSLLEIIEKV
jgi:hypothetical protein